MKPDEKKGPEPAPRANPFEALRARLGELPAGPTPAPRSAEGAKPGPKPVTERVTVRRERAGRGGKTVTLADGPGFLGRKLEPLAKEAARALGVGARVEKG